MTPLAPYPFGPREGRESIALAQTLREAGLKCLPNSARSSGWKLIALVAESQR